jgi:hypothetical protein
LLIHFFVLGFASVVPLKQRFGHNGFSQSVGAVENLEATVKDQFQLGVTLFDCFQDGDHACFLNGSTLWRFAKKLV